ncbi:acyl carrier protein [Micromonospora sp. LOL_023]|uniref:acyl carrier protein n=1 Tax=Micromonospora sp. LOL_023 TaxID=3345418 RepID=UPI003A888546
MSKPDLDDLRRILHECAGAAEGVNLDGDILDTTFADLGYDSVAMLETGSRIEQEFGIKLDDDAVAAGTPRELFAIVNASQLRA